MRLPCHSQFEQVAAQYCHRLRPVFDKSGSFSDVLLDGFNSSLMEFMQFPFQNCMQSIKRYISVATGQNDTDLVGLFRCHTCHDARCIVRGHPCKETRCKIRIHLLE